MRLLYTFLILIGFAPYLAAQQYPLFTNFITNRYGFNPAVNMDTAGICANLVFRKQWTGIDLAPQTMIAGVRGRVKPLPVGIGGYFFTDQAGVLKRSGAYGMFNFVQKLGTDTRVSVGASVGFYTFRLEEGYVPPEGGFDQLIPTALDGKQYADFNAGIYVEHKNLYAGFSVPQVIERKFDFTDLAEKSILLRHYYVIAGYRHKLNDKVWVEPSVLVKYFETAPLQVDGGLKVIFDKFWIGGTYRKDDAMTAMAGVNWNNFGLSYAYDVTTSKLRTVSTGTHEISLEMCLGKPSDRDKDGCPDKDDKCPDKPGPKENDCCPENGSSEDVASTDGLNADTDGDGIPDRQDRCPTIPGVPQNQGCPWGDRDGDGIRDDIDRCPDLPGVQSNHGCPIDDRDQDGVVDRFDKCPDVPGSLRHEGCPSMDSDGDGVADADDKCPQTKGGFENDGCPVVSDLEKEVLALAIHNLYFETDKSDINKGSYTYLNKLAELLVKQTDWKIRMTGHADSRATAEYNIALSKRRAEAVMFFLQNRGVKRSQMVVEYYGEEAPTATNASEGGRQLNRRVEMEFIFD